MTTETKEIENEHTEIAAVEINAVEVMERAVIDVQIATAKKYPRSIARFIEHAKEMVSVDEDTAVSCIYRRPVGKEGNKTIYAEGESIRLAEIVAACYGNIRVAALVTEVTPRQVKAIGMAHDLESNYAMKAEVVESTVTKFGKPFSERMRVVVAKAAQSKAIRDAIFRVVPKSLCKPIIEQSKSIAIGNNKTMSERREKAADWIKILNIEDERVFAALGIQGIEDMGEKELLILTGLRTAIKDGDVTIEDAFPPLDFSQVQEKTEKQIEEEQGSEFIDPEMKAEAEKQKQELKDSDKPRGRGRPPKKKVDEPKPYICDGCNRMWTGEELKEDEKGLQCPKCLSRKIRRNTKEKPDFMNDDEAA